MKGSAQSKPAIICPTPERAQHDGLVMQERMGDDGAPAYGARVVTQRPLDRYLARQLITADHYATGMRLYSLWRKAGKEPKLCADYCQRVASGRRDEVADAREIARQELNEALMTIPGVFSACLLAVCCMGETTGEWSASAGRHESAGMAYLRDGLELVQALWMRG